MAVYEYIAKDQRGNEFSGTYSDIESIAVLREELAKMGDTLLTARHRKSRAGKRSIRIAQEEIVTFAYKFAGMCSAGLSITVCLETLEEQTENRSFKRVLSDVRQSVATGSTLKGAFEKHRRIFSDFFLGMLEAGESGGKLSETLKTSAVYLEKRDDFRRKLKSAFTYPVVVGVMCFVVVTSLVTLIVPVFSKLYRQMRVPLPGPTQALISLSDLVRDWWWALLLLIAGAVLLLRRFSKNPYFKARWDAFKLNMPVFAKLNRMVVASHFIRTFAMLVSAGVSLVRSLEIASKVVHNAKVSEVVGRMQQSIEAGKTVAGSLRNCDIFPPLIVQLAACGEESGTLSEMLNKAAELLEKDIDLTIKSLLVKIEPAMTVIIGIVVGSILISVYMPMFDYMSHIK